MGTAAQQQLKVGDVVTVPDGTRVTVIAVAGDIAECAWFDADHHAQGGTFAIADLTLVSDPLPGSATTTAAQETTTKAPPTLDLLVDFQRWLGTRDERTGPFSRIDLPVDRQHATRIASEYLAEQA